MHHKSKIQLNLPAGNLPSLVAAVDVGAYSVYIGFPDRQRTRETYRVLQQVNLLW